MALEKAANWLSVFKNKRQFPLRQNRTYIIPTGFGFLFGGFALVLLLMALGYNNNLLYLFTFLVISVSWTGTVFTNQNIQRVEILKVETGDLYAGRANKIHFMIRNGKAKESNALVIESKQVKCQVSSVGGGETAIAEGAWQPVQRGKSKMPRLTLASDFPFAMLHAWKVFLPPEEFVVFPEPKGQAQFPNSAGIGEDQSESGIFRELREFRDFDSMRRIDWRSSLKHQKLLIRSFEDFKLQPKRRFHWENTAHLGSVDARLSQLALWIQMAESEGGMYSLVLPNLESPMGQGRAHFRDLMTRLALFEEAST